MYVGEMFGVWFAACVLDGDFVFVCIAVFDFWLLNFLVGCGGIVGLILVVLMYFFVWLKLIVLVDLNWSYNLYCLTWLVGLLLCLYFNLVCYLFGINRRLGFIICGVVFDLYFVCYLMLWFACLEVLLLAMCAFV